MTEITVNFTGGTCRSLWTKTQRILCFFPLASVMNFSRGVNSPKVCHINCLWDLVVYYLYFLGQRESTDWCLAIGFYLVSALPWCDFVFWRCRLQMDFFFFQFLGLIFALHHEDTNYMITLGSQTETPNKRVWFTIVTGDQLRSAKRSETRWIPADLNNTNKWLHL